MLCSVAESSYVIAIPVHTGALTKACLNYGSSHDALPQVCIDKHVINASSVQQLPVARGGRESSYVVAIPMHTAALRKACLNYGSSQDALPQACIDKHVINASSFQQVPVARGGR